MQAINTIIRSFSKLKIFILFFGILFLMYSCENKTITNKGKNYNSADIKKYIAKADYFYDENKHDSSLIYYNKAALLLTNPEEDYVNYVYVLSSMAEILSIDSDYTTSEELLTRTLPYLSKIKKPIYARNVYSNIAYNYYNTYDYENSILYHKKALRLPGSPYKKALILNDIAIVYTAQEKYDAAIEILKLLTSEKIIFKKRPKYSDQFHANVLTNLGYSYLQQKSPEAIKYLKEGLKKNLKINNEFSLDYNYRLLSEFYQNSNPKLALFYAKKSYEHAILVKSARNTANSLAQLIRTSEGSELKKYSLDYIKIIDSITEGRRRAKNQFANIKYLSQKDKKENLQLKTDKIENELELERAKNRNFILYVVIAFSLATLLFLFYYLISKGKKEKIDAVYKSEARIAAKLQAELSHEIYKALTFTKKNDVENKENKQQLLSRLNNIYLKTRNISRENSEILTDENFENVLKEMISSYTNPNLNIIINGLNGFSWLKIDRIKKITVFRVLQEILDVMKSLNDASLLSITFKKEEKNILIMYVDNGTKISSQDTILQKRLQNVENRIKTIKGTLNFDEQSENSFKISFKFPI